MILGHPSKRIQDLIQISYSSPKTIIIYNDGTHKIYDISGALTAAKLDNNVSNIKEYYIGTNITSLSQNAFNATETNIIDVISIPNTVTSMENIFASKKTVNKLILPPNFEKIGSSTFFSSTANNLYISDVATWCNMQFKANSSSTEVDSISSHPFSNYYVEGNLYLHGALVNELTIPDGVTTINFGVFYNCKSLQKVNFNKDIKVIGQQAFQNTNLKTLVLPEGLETINDSAFTSIDATEVTIPKSVTSIGSQIFFQSAIKTITMAGRTKSEAITFMNQMRTQNQGDVPFDCGNVTYICTDGSFKSTEY